VGGARLSRDLGLYCRQAVPKAGASRPLRGVDQRFGRRGELSAFRHGWTYQVRTWSPDTPTNSQRACRGVGA